MKILSWLLGAIGGGSKTSAPTPVIGGNVPLPPLPVGSVAAVADALTQAGRIVEQQENLRNTPAMQNAKISQEAVAEQDRIERDVASEDVERTREDLAN